MVKVAVVGVNNIGKIHCQHYHDNNDVEFVAVCDLDKQLADTQAFKFDVKSYTDMKEMLEKEDIDMVSVATGGKENGSHHYEPVMIAMEAGKDVLVEKPISNNIEEAREMVAFAEKHGIRLACNLNHRFIHTAEKAKEWVKANELGELLFVNMKLTIKNPNESSPWIHLRALHPHSIDVIRYFAGDISRVQAFMTKAPGRSIWSTASINLEFASGAVGHLTGSFDMDMNHPIEYCEVAGNKGRFIIDNVYESLTLYPHNNSELKVVRNSIMTGASGFNDTFNNRLASFIQEIKDGVSPAEIKGSGRDALAAQEVIEAAIQSQLNDGVVVEVPPYNKRTILR